MIKLVHDLWILKINRSNDCIWTPCDSGEPYDIEKFPWINVPMALCLHQQNWALLFISAAKKTLKSVVKTLDSRNAKQMKQIRKQKGCKYKLM